MKNRTSTPATHAPTESSPKRPPQRWEDDARTLTYCVLRDRILGFRLRHAVFPPMDMALAALQADIWNDLVAVFERARVDKEGMA